MAQLFDSRRFFAVLSFVLVLLIGTALPTFAAPTIQEEDPAQEEITIADILAAPELFEGQIVTLTGEATRVGLGRNMFTLRAGDLFDVDRLPVLTSRALLRGLEEGEPLEVTGRIYRFDPETIRSQVTFQLDERTLSLDGRPVMIAESIRTLPADLLAAGEGLEEDVVEEQMEEDAASTVPELTTPVEEDENVLIRIGERTVTQEEFDRRFGLVVRNLTQGQGIPLNEGTMQLFEGLRTRYLEQLATEEALLAEAERRGISISDEDLQAQIDQIREQFPNEEVLQQILQEMGFESEAMFRDFLRTNEVLRRIGNELSQEIGVTGEEVQQYYEENPELFETPQGVLPLAQVRNQIRQRLQMERLGERLTELRQEIGVEIFRGNLQPMQDLEMDEE